MNINKQVNFINGLSDFLKFSGSFYYCIMKGENKPHGWQSGGPQSAVCFSCAALSWFWFNPFNPKILLVILLNDRHTNSHDFSSEDLLLDQLIIPYFILLFVLIPCLLDIVWIL